MIENQRQNKEKPALQILRAMGVGEVISFPASRLNSIKSLCSTFGFQWDKRFRTSMNRENKTVVVTRIA